MVDWSRSPSRRPQAGHARPATAARPAPTPSLCHPAAAERSAAVTASAPVDRSDPPLAVWGGVECTVNRVGDRVFDQFDRNGHATRLDDLDRFADLGIGTLRTPVLWERVAPDGLARADWAWPDAALDRMRALGTTPIVGLVHHGSGPRATSLVDPAFAGGLASFARAVAERYPHVDAYTPVNEPLTTARFSGLYGHWYPHGRDERTFARALVTQIQATVLAMRAVREVNPAARLVQTEDLGHVWSTAALAGQAAMENERRWLTWDLLCGRVGRDHPMWDLLLSWGIGADELDAFQEHPCPPDVVGVNHYVTSERFLDGRGRAAGGYVDVEAVRALHGGAGGLAPLLANAGRRYGLPLAVTEAHLGCTREEQVRWLAEVWRAADAARAGGADVRAVTVWALLGSFDWDRLLTDPRGRYEPGVFDVRSATPRPTALAGVVRALAAGCAPEHPVLDGPGWWHRDFRLSHPPAVAHRAPATRIDVPAVVGTRTAPRPILIVGSDEALGDAALRLCGIRGLAAQTLVCDETDALAAALAQWQPWAVVDAATGGAGALGAALPAPDARAAACRAALVARAGAALVTFSSDAVFAPGTVPRVETDRPDATSAWGRACAAADDAVQAAHPAALVVRTAPWVSPWARADRFRRGLDVLAAGRPVAAPTGSAVYLVDAVHAALDLLVDGERGLWHLASQDDKSAAGLFRLAAVRAGLDGSRIMPDAVPPRRVRLASIRGTCLPSASEMLEHLFERDAGWSQPETARRGVRRVRLPVPA